MQFKFDCQHFHEIHPADSFPQYDVNRGCDFSTNAMVDIDEVYKSAHYNLVEYDENKPAKEHHYMDNPQLQQDINDSIVKIPDGK